MNSVAVAYDGAGVSCRAFQRILKERTFERKQRMKAQRRMDVQRINERKSKDGIHPLEQFPKEIWAMILKELSPSDRRTMWELHPLFQKMMESTRVRDILLPLVVSFEVPEFWRSKSNREEDVFRLYFPEKVTSPLACHILLRKVCKDLRDAIDQWFEDNIIKTMRTGDTETGLTPIMIYGPSLTLFEEKDKEILQKMVANFSEGNLRFFMRVLEINISNSSHLTDMRNIKRYIESNYNQFKDNITTLIEKIGDQILYFRLFALDGEMLLQGGLDYTEVYAILQRWLSLMPNLMWLSLDIRLGSKQRIRSLKRLRQAIDNQAFPKLEKLESIWVRLDENCIEGIDIFVAALQSNTHVSRLRIYAEKNVVEMIPPSSISSLTQVQSLTIYNQGFHRYDYDLFILKPLMNPRWPLKRLKLSFDMESEPMSSHFQFLEKFPTLEELFIQIDRLKIESDSDMAFLKLPNLTHLEFKFCPEIDYKASIHFFFSLQFLIECRKLKTLSWQNRCWEEFQLIRHMKNYECHERMINFRAGFRDLLFSNIWDLFPCLEFVALELCDMKKNTPTYIKEFRRSDRFY